MDGDEDDAQFLRNLHLVSTRSVNNNNSNSNNSKQRNSPKALLRSFVRDLSFWEAPPANHRGSINTNSDPSLNRQESSAISASSSRNGKKTKTMKNRDNKKSNDRSQSGDSTSMDYTLSQPIWKTAVDSASGKVYYYDAITRKTQWNKPAELKALEKRRKLEKRQRDQEFFKEMESNIRDSIARGETIPGIPLRQTKPEGPPLEPQNESEKDKSSRVRTISGMDEILLAELRDDDNVTRQNPKERQTVPSIVRSSSITDLSGRPPLPTGPGGPRRFKVTESMELSPDDQPSQKVVPSASASASAGHPLKGEPELAGEKLLDEPIQTEYELLAELNTSTSTSPPAGHTHTRRNTGGTIYLENTMTNPDVKATIKCVCGVYRAHIVQAVERQSSRSPISVVGSPLDLDVFVDDYGARRKRKTVMLPSLADVLAFYEEFYRRSQMEHDTIIMSLIYVERLVKASNGILTPSPENWRSILFACMVLASKVWDDLSMWNVDFSNVSAATAGLASFTLFRINQLELALLKSLNFDVKVPASEYAKYYFLIRTMSIRSGLVKEGEKPVGKIEAFHKLETRTSKYQDTQLARMSRDRRAKSMDDNFLVWLAAGDSNRKPGPVLRDTVCLEQLAG